MATPPPSIPLPTVAWILVPSKNAPGKFNVQVRGFPGNMSTDPNGVISFKVNEDGTPADGNYEQYTQSGVAVEIRPGSDNNPETAPTIVILPPTL